MLQTKNSTRNFFAMNPVATENVDEKHIRNFIAPIANQHLVLSAKELEGKGNSMIRALYILRLTKRHVLGQRNVEQ